MTKRKPGGRLKKLATNKRGKSISFYMTDVQYFIVQQKVIQAGVNISDYMRQLAVTGHVKPRWTEEEREMFKQIVGMSNDLHQFVGIAEKEGAVNAVLYFSQSRDRIDEVLKHFGDDK